MNYPRTNYEMTEEQLRTLLGAMTAQPVMKIGAHWSGMDQQERANAAWKVLGDEMGFDPMTCQPRAGMGSRFFTAIPLENETQRVEREAKERADKRAAEILTLEREIAERTARLAELNTVTVP